MTGFTQAIRGLVRRLIPQPVRAFRLRVLATHSVSVSQAGQDAWVYGPVFNGKRAGYFVDIGAHDGMYLNNTFLLERRFGWTGLCIEPNPISFTKLVALRRATCLNVCLDGAVGTVDFSLDDLMGGIVADDTDNRRVDPANEVVTLPTTTLLQVLDEHQAPQTIDYLSLDVEGAEERILLNFDFTSYRFRCLTIERPSARLQATLEQAGYRLVAQIPGLDHFYVHESFEADYHRNTLNFHGRSKYCFGIRRR